MPDTYHRKLEPRTFDTAAPFPPTTSAGGIGTYDNHIKQPHPTQLHVPENPSSEQDENVKKKPAKTNATPDQIDAKSAVRTTHHAMRLSFLLMSCSLPPYGYEHESGNTRPQHMHKLSRNMAIIGDIRDVFLATP